MDQEIKKSCWGITFWAVTAFVLVLGLTLLVKQDGSKQAASIAVETNVQ